MDDLLNSIDSTEDYSFEQLKEAVQRRQSSMQRIKDIYANDPRMKRSGVDVGLEEFSGQDFGGNSRVSYKPFIDGKNKQLDFLRQSQLEPELLQQKFDETDPFTDMLKKVMAAKKGGGGFPFETKVIAPGVAIVINRTTGLSTTLGVDDVNKFMSAVERHYKAFIDGGVTDVKLAQSQAWALANADIEKAKSHRNVPGMASDSPVNPSVRTPAINSEGAAIPPIGTKPALVRGSEPAIARPVTGSDGKAALDNIANRFTTLQRDLQNKKIDKPTFDMRTKVLNEERMRIMSSEELMPSSAHEQGGVSITQEANPPALMSLREKKVNEKLAEGEVTEYEATKEQMKAMYSANENIRPMEGILLSGKHTSGQLHETLNKIGGYFNYIDPNGSLAQAVGNDAAYFGNMMNLVRDKIKALGAGTAVSNLDLIVTQKSVGDLRNTPQGNLKVLGLTKLFNATMGEQGQRKVDYFDQNSKLQGYKTNTEPTHAIRARRNPYKDGSIMSYDVQSKDEWVKEQMRRNPGKEIPEDILDREWKRFADDSVRAMFK